MSERENRNEQHLRILTSGVRDEFDYEAVKYLKDKGYTDSAILKSTRGDSYGKVFSVCWLGPSSKGLDRIDELKTRINANEYIPQKIERHNTFEKGLVFIGHGRSAAWRDLKYLISERLRLQCVEFNSVSVAGITTVDRLKEMLSESSFAFLVMTAEDSYEDGSRHARENVVHEIGLFQARLGFNRAIVLLEDECQEFSNIAGVGQIRFSKDKILEKSGDILMVLEREGMLPVSNSMCLKSEVHS